MELRRFARCDLPGLYRVCLRTGAVGQDATDRYTDPDLLGHLYAGAYPTADPALSWVVRDDRGVAGYLVATADSAAFAAWQEEHWWPELRERYPLPGTGTEDDLRAISTIHAGQPPRTAVLDRYPAHLHIDLLPRAQGSGMGRRLIDAVVTELRARGVPGLHLGVAEANTGAIAFYDRVGFSTESRDDAGRLLVMDLTTA
ncbi:GNAT family N-acetyltransferase [Cellulomonas taurus]|uniref:GNAT family N-acetyltransferase n=1 Tax=Cellulomonas taurus TaxID=2729175 RepID=UPI00145DCAB1|nr:GNAT family N-acetyltransferase [Cellulomonas taurus]